MPRPLLRPAEAAEASKSAAGPGDGLLPHPGSTGGVRAPPDASASLGVPQKHPGAYSEPALTGRRGDSDLRKRPPPELSLGDLVARSAARSAARMLLNDLVSRSASRSAARLMSAKYKSKGRPHNPHIFSRVYPDFLCDNPKLESLTIFLDSLLMSESTGPSESGTGVKLSADTPHSSKKPTVNVERVAYLRNYFGRDCTAQTRTSPRGTASRYSYSTGSGMTTHGTPSR